MRSYLKPEITKEVLIRRDLVYAQAEDEIQKCTTLVKKTDKDNDKPLV